MVRIGPRRRARALLPFLTATLALAVVTAPARAQGGDLLPLAPPISHETKPVPVVQTGHSGMLRAIAFSPDGRTVVSAGTDMVIVWDATTGAARHRLGGWPIRWKAWSSAATVAG